jgi:hypothetical protein
MGVNQGRINEAVQAVREALGFPTRLHTVKDLDVHER